MAQRIQGDPVASKALGALEPFDLDALYGRLTAEGNGPRTVEHRHMCATQMVAMGVDVLTGSAHLGHSVPRTFTNTYAHGLSQTAKQAPDNLGQLARVALPQATSNSRVVAVLEEVHQLDRHTNEASTNLLL
jgi:hypothetical protein